MYLVACNTQPKNIFKLLIRMIHNFQLFTSIQLQRIYSFCRLPSSCVKHIIKCCCFFFHWLCLTDTFLSTSFYLLFIYFMFNQKVRWNTEGTMPIWVPPTKKRQSSTKNNRNTNNTTVYHKKKPKKNKQVQHKETN